MLEAAALGERGGWQGGGGGVEGGVGRQGARCFLSTYRGAALWGLCAREEPDNAAVRGDARGAVGVSARRYELTTSSRRTNTKAHTQRQSTSDGACTIPHCYGEHPSSANHYSRPPCVFSPTTVGEESSGWLVGIVWCQGEGCAYIRKRLHTAAPMPNGASEHRTSAACSGLEFATYYLWLPVTCVLNTCIYITNA